MSTVSVIIPVHNGWDLVHRSIGSALNQRGPEVQVVVVDDGSRHPAPPHIARMVQRHGELLRHETAQGVCAARNAGIARADGEWLAFLDHDDFWAPTKLARQIEALTARPGHHWSFTSAVEVEPRLRPIGLQRESLDGFRTTLGIRNCVPGGGSSVMASAAVVRELGGFDPQISFSGDWDMWIRLTLQGNPVAIDDVLCAYLITGNSMSNRRPDLHAEMATFVRKYAHADDFTMSPDMAGIDDWLADRRRSAGDRREPALDYARQALRLRSPRIAARALSTLVWPGWVWHRRRAVYRHLARDPAIASWLTTAWLPRDDPRAGR